MKPAVTDYVIRPAMPGDIDAFRELKSLAGPGFTSLAVPDDELEARLAASVADFAADIRAPNEEHYFLAMAHRETRAIVGMAQVKASIGVSKPFFNYRVLRIAQASAAAKRRFDLDVLALVNEFTGCAEVGSLFVRAEHRRGGVGRALAQARYMLIAAAPERFGPRVIAELRGVIDEGGVSPFWEHLGRTFFKMTFEEADRLSATSDNQFILDLMPKYPIYADLLHPDARAVIGKCHRDGEGARKLLADEGFLYDGVIDIFDGGPVMTAPRDAIRVRREAKRRAIRASDAGGGALGLVARTPFSHFLCAPALLNAAGEGVVVDRGAFDALGGGAQALVWRPDGA
jgi:arginine N-succinyltransferase